MANEFPVRSEPADSVESNEPAGSAAGLPRPITCIINTHSRKGREQYKEAVAALESAGVPIAEAHAVDSKAETIRLLRREVENGANLVIVGGGDGTLSDCAEHLAGTTVAMGVLPLGTGNTLARSLGIPLDLQSAARTLADGHIIAMDVGRVNGKAFLNSVSLGLSCEIAHALTPEVKKRLGIFSWTVTGFKVLTRHHALTLHVQSAERNYRVRTHQLVVANGRYVAGPVASAPDAAINDHNLDVFVLGRDSKKTLVRATLRWIRGKHMRSRDTLFFRTRALRIESLRGRVPVDIDGEIDAHTPLDITIEPASLRVVVPHGYDASSV